MRVLVVGGGAREHALCWAFARSPLCKKLFCAPGNAGIAAVATCLPIKAEAVEAIVAACHEQAIDFVMVGPEAPLALGLVDALHAEGFAVFGPSRAAAQLESSKGFMKDLCAAAGVPTAPYRRVRDLAAAESYIRERFPALEGKPIVVKADGLAAGKGVTVARTLEDALTAAREALAGKFGTAGAELVIEDGLIGEEASFFALVDGEKVRPFAGAQDHKAAFDGDQGPNTGGMGAYSPAPILSPALIDQVMDSIVAPTARAMVARGTTFRGVLFAGLMHTAAGPMLIEYNVRFGDPETQVMLPRLESDLLALLFAATQGGLMEAELRFSADTALGVVLATRGYPAAHENGSRIRGLDAASQQQGAQRPHTQIFHAATKRGAGGVIEAHGGRVLTVVGRAPNLPMAQKQAYEAVAAIDWPEGFYRKDIGWRALKDRR